MSATPSSAPAEATKTTTPPVETVFDDVKNNTQRELQKLKDKLEVKDTDSTHSKEWEKIKEKFTAEKETITKISEVELVQLKKDIHDSNEELTGELKVEAGSLVYHEVVADGTSATPETPTTEPSNQETPVNLGDITTQVPESYQKEVKNYIVDNG